MRVSATRGRERAEGPRRAPGPLKADRVKPVSPFIESVIKVLVSANSAGELAGLESLIRTAHGLELAGSCLGKQNLAAKLAETHPDVLLECPPSAGRDLEGEPVPPAVVWLVARSGFAGALDAVREGAVQAVLPVWAGAREIAAAIEAVAHGLVVLDTELTEYVGGAPVPEPDSLALERDHVLSPREIEILNLLASGLANKEIAFRLNISEHTVKFHVTSIFNKLSVSSRAAATAVGIRLGLVAV